MTLNVLMTVYNESEFVEYAIRSCLPYVGNLVIVEGAYQETIKLGMSSRSTDGTLEIIEKFRNDPKVSIIYANENTDKDQRNVGLEAIKKLDPGGWLLIIDGDEVYEMLTLKQAHLLSRAFERTGKYAAYFTSMTFVNDFKHYTLQEFPRLFKLTSKCEFVNDNFMKWDHDERWDSTYVTKIPHMKYFHYAFCKDTQRFELKKKWWETRFGKPFDYGWKVGEDGKITDKNHRIYEFTGKHPEIMKGHRLYHE